jgi:uncharacterized protein YaiL (DUF2058 family)
MGSLRDEMLKKGLTTDKRARAVLHEEKARQKQLGAEGVALEREARAAEVARAEAEKRAQDRELAAERRARETAERAENRVDSLVRAGLLREGVAGTRRFYFVTRENTVSFLELSDTAARSLTDGRAAIVEAGGLVRADFCLVAGEQAAEIARLDHERVRFWNAGGASRD